MTISDSPVDLRIPARKTHHGGSPGMDICCIGEKRLTVVQYVQSAEMHLRNHFLLTNPNALHGLEIRR